MDLENFICYFGKNLVDVAMRTAEAFYNILYGTESMIADTEGHSRIYNYSYKMTVSELKSIHKFFVDFLTFSQRPLSPLRVTMPEN